MLYLMGKIDLFSRVVARFALLLEAIDQAARGETGLVMPDDAILFMAKECYVGGGNATLPSLRLSLIDAVVDLAHQLQSIEEDICYERKRLLEADMAELCGQYWKARHAMRHLMDDIVSRHGVKMPRLSPDPFGAELNLGLF